MAAAAAAAACTPVVLVSTSRIFLTVVYSSAYGTCRDGRMCAWFALHLAAVQPRRLILSGSSEEQTVRLYCAQTGRLIHSAEMYPGRKHGSLYVQSLR